MFSNMFNNEKVNLAVVGIRASGKSYLLSDILTSLSNLGFCIEKDLNSDLYQGVRKFSATVETEGRLAQTEMYACRPGETIYGATYNRNGKKIDLTFVDIPGEVFDGLNTVGNNTFLTVFTVYCNALRKMSKKLFTVSVWQDYTGKEQFVVEPILPEKHKKDIEDRRKTIVDFNNDDYIKSRSIRFQGWSYIFSWLEFRGYKEKRKIKISGKELLQNFLQYQPDSLMCSLAELVDTICPGLFISQNDFENGHNKEAFYFLYYCSIATDIVLCDKLFVPGDNGTCELDSQDNFNKYATITGQLSNFIRDNRRRANVYLAFRGVDFLMRTKEQNYADLVNNLRLILCKKKNEEINIIDDIIRNSVYSLFAYLLWHHVDPQNNINFEGFNDLIGISMDSLSEVLGKKEITQENFHTVLADNFLDVRCGNNEDMNVEGIINSHVGHGPANSFRFLLHESYGYQGAVAGTPMIGMPSHVYFTATPITSDFKIYINGSGSDELKFMHPKQVQGPAKYFHTAGSNFCFGTYQLCLDILKHHNFNIHDWSDFGELINMSID